LSPLNHFTVSCAILTFFVVMQRRLVVAHGASACRIAVASLSWDTHGGSTVRLSSSRAAEPDIARDLSLCET
jgi:hypothetical protein